MRRRRPVSYHHRTLSILLAGVNLRKTTPHQKYKKGQRAARRSHIYICPAHTHLDMRRSEEENFIATAASSCAQHFIMPIHTSTFFFPVVLRRSLVVFYLEEDEGIKNMYVCDTHKREKKKKKKKEYSVSI